MIHRAFCPSQTKREGAKKTGDTYMYVNNSFLLLFSPQGSDFSKLTSNWATVWVKISSSWVCIALYTWTLIAPVMFPDREFGR